MADLETVVGSPGEAVNQAAAHTLFVEGRDDNAVDPQVLSRLMKDTAVTIRALGPSFHVKSAAQALHPHHPTYYFVIDRDHHDETTVEESWKNFPNKDTYNLLIWRKRELENYFLDPKFLGLSSFLKSSADELETRLIKLCSKRIFFDIANQTIAMVRELQKVKWVEDFTNPDNFKTATSALTQLKNCDGLKQRASAVAEDLKFEKIEKIFLHLQESFLSGATTPEFGKGKWLDTMRGKPILAALVSECFEVIDLSRNRLTGRGAVTLLAADLLEKEPASQPSDFQQLHQLIKDRI